MGPEESSRSQGKMWGSFLGGVSSWVTSGPLRRRSCFRRKGALAEGGLEPGPLGEGEHPFHPRGSGPSLHPASHRGGNGIRGVRPRPAEHVLLCLA